MSPDVNLVIDLTHGGVKIAISLAKNGEKVLAYDIYNTLKELDKKMLDVYGVELITLEDLKYLNANVKVISPIHLPLSNYEIASYNENLNYTFITHHEAVGEILGEWGRDILKIEVTGVKGKTSSVFMLKEILIDKNPLILSSLGAVLYENSKEIILKKNISITPANIKESIDLAYKIANSICEISEGKVKSGNLKKYSSSIFESSLGGCGIGDVGLLTNINEDYPIAKNRLTSSKAKEQIFNCKVVCCQKEAFDKYYPSKNANTFSLSDKTANLYLTNVEYGSDKTIIEAEYSNIKTINDNIIKGEIKIESFILGKHNVENVLGVIATALSAEISEKDIIDGFKNYTGIAGRTNKKTIDDIIIIEEINPGLNTTSIKQSIEMIRDLNNYYIAVGGDYGITCEEIDENRLASYLDSINEDVILTGKLGHSISKKIKKKYEYISDYTKVYDKAIDDNKNLLFIYRSDYRRLSLR